MSSRNPSRFRRTHLLALAAAATVSLAVAGAAEARGVKKVKPATVINVEAPFGLQGTAGAGQNVAIPFALRDRSYRLSNVDMQVGFDRNGDGPISNEEFVNATEARFDPRDTRRDHNPQLFKTAADQGAAHAIVWRTTADMPGARVLVGPQFELTPQGRIARDPFDSTQPKVEFDSPGVQIRLRAISSSRHKGPWVYSGGMSVDNDAKPSVTIDYAINAAPGAATVLTGWTATDASSEDLNGNGVLDIGLGEDANDNNVLDMDKCGVAFDWHRLAANENPALMSDLQLSALTWTACTRDVTLGDTDSMVVAPNGATTGGLVAGAPGAGRSYTFAWNTAFDIGPTTDRFILRATPFDARKAHGATAYSRIIVRPGQ